jgi:hypothetical protein
LPSINKKKKQKTLGKNKKRYDIMMVFLLLVFVNLRSIYRRKKISIDYIIGIRPSKKPF